jgi:hypothetical protein
MKIKYYDFEIADSEDGYITISQEDVYSDEDQKITLSKDQIESFINEIKTFVNKNLSV